MRENFPEFVEIEKQIQSTVSLWKKELDSYDNQIDDLKSEIEEKSSLWKEEQLKAKLEEIELLTEKISLLSKKFFEEGGEYDMLIKDSWTPLEDSLINYKLKQKLEYLLELDQTEE